MKKVVLKLEFADEKIKQKSMKTVSGLSGVESIAMDPKDKKLTITGDIDPVKVVAKLRKLCGTEIVSVGPAKEPEKKKEEPKKDDGKKGDERKKMVQNKKLFICRWFIIHIIITNNLIINNIHHLHIMLKVWRRIIVHVLFAKNQYLILTS